MKVTIRRDSAFSSLPWCWTVRGSKSFIDTGYAATEGGAETEAITAIDNEIERRNTPVREFTYGPD